MTDTDSHVAAANAVPMHCIGWQKHVHPKHTPKTRLSYDKYKTSKASASGWKIYQNYKTSEFQQKAVALITKLNVH